MRCYHLTSAQRCFDANTRPSDMYWRLNNIAFTGHQQLPVHFTYDRESQHYCAIR